MNPKAASRSTIRLSRRHDQLVKQIIPISEENCIVLCACSLQHHTKKTERLSDRKHASRLVWNIYVVQACLKITTHGSNSEQTHTKACHDRSPCFSSVCPVSFLKNALSHLFTSLCVLSFLLVWIYTSRAPFDMFPSKFLEFQPLLECPCLVFPRLT